MQYRIKIILSIFFLFSLTILSVLSVFYIKNSIAKRERLQKPNVSKFIEFIKKNNIKEAQIKVLHLPNYATRWKIKNDGTFVFLSDTKDTCGAYERDITCHNQSLIQAQNLQQIEAENLKKFTNPNNTYIISNLGAGIFDQKNNEYLEIFPNNTRYIHQTILWSHTNDYLLLGLAPEGTFTYDKVYNFKLYVYDIKNKKRSYLGERIINYTTYYILNDLMYLISPTSFLAGKNGTTVLYTQQNTNGTENSILQEDEILPQDIKLEELVW